MPDVERTPSLKDIDALEAILKAYGGMHPVDLASFGIRKTTFGYQVVEDGFTIEYGNLQSLFDGVGQFWWRNEEKRKVRDSQNTEYMRVVLDNWAREQIKPAKRTRWETVRV